MARGRASFFEIGFAAHGLRPGRSTRLLRRGRTSFHVDRISLHHLNEL